MNLNRNDTKFVNNYVLNSTAAYFKKNKLLLPTFTELQDPSSISQEIIESLKLISPDDPHPLNLFRLHWFNNRDAGEFSDIPDHVILPTELTGVSSPIIVVFGDTFPMIGAHKVLPAYACLVPRLISGEFDPQKHCAIWPSTGNYCRGGVAISRILGCRGIAVLPEGMSQERFDWLEKWVMDSKDIIRTPGTESDVKAIYDTCAELQQDEENFVFNQFSEFGNYIAHYLVTGTALAKVYKHVKNNSPNIDLKAFVGTSGSSGTLAAGDYLKEQYSSNIAVAEPVECPTMLCNGYGEHNIQGIGDKHIPYIHNVMNTDFVIGVSDKSTDALNVLFNTDIGHAFLSDHKGIEEKFTGKTLGRLGLSSIANVLAAIKLSKYMKLSANEAIITIATDNSKLYGTERSKIISREYAGNFNILDAAETFGKHLSGIGTSEVAELSIRDRERIFNLGYFTWVEQQGVTLDDFEERKDQSFWKNLLTIIPEWNRMIENFNKILIN